MTVHGRRAWLGNRAWQLASLPEYQRFVGGLAHLRETQEALLASYLRQQRDTVFGRRHEVGRISDYRAFRQQIPISSYEQLLPFLRYRRGLSPDPVKVWEPTGGSSGGSKFIPWTARLQREFRRAVAVWMWQLFRRYPAVVSGRSYWQLTPKCELDRPDWLPDQRLGFASDGDYLGPLGRLLEQMVLLSTPAGPELWARTVETMRQARDLRLISCWSPTFLLCLQRHFLERFGCWQPQRWWPELRLISCWASAASEPYRARIETMFPGVAIEPKGLLATEAVTTIPLGERYPLAYRSHFFEFDCDGQSLPSWQLETGLEASVIVTTGSGMTRYDTADRVRVTGFLGQVPCLEFLGRHGTVDRVGEKLSLPLIEQALARLPGFAMLGFEDCGYVVFAAASRIDDPTTALADVEAVLYRCYSYKDARILGQLRPLRLFAIEGDPLAQYSANGGAGVLKPLAFHSDGGWSQRFEGRFL